MREASNADETEIKCEKNGSGNQPGDNQGRFLSANIDSEENNRVEIVGKGRKRVFDEVFDSGGHRRGCYRAPEASASGAGWLEVKSG